MNQNQPECRVASAGWREARSAGSPSPVTRHPSSKLRIFLVEDHPLMRRSLLEAIAREPDLTVCGQAADAPAALAAIVATPPDVVLTDLRLQSSSGLDLIKSLRERLPRLPIVATTMFDVRQNERLARAAGATGFVAKGDGPDPLLAALRQVLEGDR